MFRFTTWAAVLVAVVVLAVQQARAGIGFQPVSQEELKMTSEPLAPGAPAIILYREVDRDDDLRSPHEDTYLRIKILTAEGRKHADVEIRFIKELEDIVNIHARTIRPDGSTVDFGGSIFEKYIVKGKIAGTEIKVLVKTFTLTDVQVGSIIEYSFTRKFHDYSLYNSHWFLSEELFTRKARFTLKPFAGYGYSDVWVRWTWNFLPPGADPPQKEHDNTVRMEVSNIPAFETEDYMPPPDELKYRVDFTYRGGQDSSDAESYWKRVEKAWNEQLEGVLNKRSAMEKAVAQIVSPGDPAELKLRKIYDRVQQLRNTSYEDRRTEQEQKRAKEKVVDNPNVEQIWKRGYGKGAQLTWLFLGLVRAAGFEAYACLVASRDEYFFTPNTMQAHKLNSSVVLVKLNGKDLYLDPGGAFTPFGLLAWPETAAPGLRLDKDNGTWIQTTLPQASESQTARVGRLKLTESGDLEGKLTITYTGLEAMYHRLEERHGDDVERKKYLEERVTSQIGSAGGADLTNKPDWASSETPLVAQFDIKIPNWMSNAGRKAMIPAALFTASEKGIFEHANRIYPIYFDYPYTKADDINIELPPGWQVTGLPAAKDRDGHVIRYMMNVDKNGDSLHLTRKLTVDVMTLDKKYYSDLRRLFQTIRTDDGEQIVLQPGEVHASN